MINNNIDRQALTRNGTKPVLEATTVWRLIALIALMISSNFLWADEASDCYDRAISQAQLNNCAKQQRQYDYDQLQRLVNELHSILPAKSSKQLLIAQKAWKTMTQLDCSIEHQYMTGGSARSMIVSICYSRHIKERTQTLSRLLCHPMKDECQASDKYSR